MTAQYHPKTAGPGGAKLMIFSSLFAFLVVFLPVTLPGLPQTPGEQIAFVYPKCSQATKDYFLLKYATAIASPLLCSVAILAFLHFGFIARLKDKMKIKSTSLMKTAGFAFVIYLICFTIRLPFSFYSGYLLEHQFGLSTQSIGLWLHDLFGVFLEGLIIVPILCLLLLLIRRFPKSWFFWVWLLLSAVTTAIAFVEPLVVDPYFNKFRELPESKLKTDIIAISHKSGMENPLILVADKSKQTKKLNAYVNGIASTKRIVLYDNLVNDVPEEQILVVVAHELGHYRLGHVMTGLALAIAAMLPLLYFWKFCTDKILPLLPRQWGIKSSSDPAIMAAWCIVIWIAPLVIAPVPAFFSRLLEAEADAYAIRTCGDPLNAARVFCTLSEKNLSDPDPPAFIEFWFFTHPSLKHRIDYALSQLKLKQATLQPASMQSANSQPVITNDANSTQDKSQSAASEEN